MPDVETIAVECDRIKEDAEHSAKAHFDVAARWGVLHLWLGVPTAVIAAVAGISAFKGQPVVAGALAVAVAAATAVTTFLNASGRATQHLGAGNQYLALRNQTRIFQEIVLHTLPLEQSVARLLELADRRDELNNNSPQAPRWAFERARQGISEGETSYRVDARKN